MTTVHSKCGAREWVHLTRSRLAAMHSNRLERPGSGKSARAATLPAVNAEKV